MEPLRRLTLATSRLEAYAVELVRATTRYEPPAGEKQRVRAKLLGARSHSKGFALRPTIVFAMILCAAGASATVGREWVRSRSAASSAEKVKASGVAASRGAAARLMRPTTGASATPVSDLEPSPAATNESSEAPLATAPSPVSPSPRTRKVESDSSKSGHSEASHGAKKRAQEEAGINLVFDAMRALRREGQPERAAKLLEEYLQRYPNGSLSEEALALSIEAATVRGGAGVRELADRYLARYPGGQFRSAAERARARFSQ